MVVAVNGTMSKLRGHWKLTDEQFVFCSRLFNLYRLRTGHKFNKRLRGWLFFNQETRLHAADFIAFLSLFDMCADDAEANGLNCDHSCQDYAVCIHIYDTISNLSDYSPNKIGDSDRSWSPESPVLHGSAVELLRFLDSFRF